MPVLPAHRVSSARLFALLAIALTGIPAAAWAHVKWFSEFSFSDRPLTLSQALTPTVWALLILSVVVVAALVWVDRRIETAGWFTRLDERLAAYRDRSDLILRIGAGATFLLAWQADALFFPELDAAHAWIGWWQFGLALLLLFRRTVPVAGGGLLLLYGYGIWTFGALHMLDYVFLAGVGVYFLVAQSEQMRVRELRLPALYLTVGFALCWVALEKLIYPQWGLYVLEQNPQLALSLPIDFFLTSAAFVEFSLGYLLIICLLQRPLALVITLVFFTTTLIFGKTEVIGHTLIHAALVVFVIEGPGRFYRAPYAFHKQLGLRTAFAGVNVALLFGLLIVPYAWLSWNAYEQHAANVSQNLYELPSGETAPTIALDVQPDPHGGYLVRVDAIGFRFSSVAPAGDHAMHSGSAMDNAAPVDAAPVPTGEGHAHLYVDGRKVGRMYAPVHHLDLPSGTHRIAVALSTPDHRMYASGGQVIVAEQTVDVP